MISKYIHIAANEIILFYLMAVYYAIVYMHNITLSIPLLVDI